ncbi:MAG: class I SAM-dependent methyltransferase [Caldilineaceae bacterium]
MTSAVDVGTGTGRHALRLAKQGIDVVGVDENPDMLAVAQAKADAANVMNMRFIQAELGKEALPLPSSTFDLLTCTLMLCHLPNLKEAIADCVRVVRPGGYLLLSDFHPDAIAFGWRSAFPTPTTHYYFPTTAHTRQGYLDALTECGCALIDVQDFATDGQPCGDLSEEARMAKGGSPFCLVILAQKE